MISLKILFSWDSPLGDQTSFTEFRAGRRTAHARPQARLIGRPSWANPTRLSRAVGAGKCALSSCSRRICDLFFWIFVTPSRSSIVAPKARPAQGMKLRSCFGPKACPLVFARWGRPKVTSPYKAVYDSKHLCHPLLALDCC